MVPPKTHSARNAVSAADEAHRGTQWLLLLKGHLPTFWLQVQDFWSSQTGLSFTFFIFNFFNKWYYGKKRIHHFSFETKHRIWKVLKKSHFTTLQAKRATFKFWIFALKNYISTLLCKIRYLNFGAKNQQSFF